MFDTLIHGEVHYSHPLHNNSYSPLLYTHYQQKISQKRINENTNNASDTWRDRVNRTLPGL